MPRDTAVIPRVVVIVVTYNSAAVIGRCLASVPAAVEGLELVALLVVDNASSDDTVQGATRAHPGVRIVDSGGNLGYGAAINIGVRSAPEHDLIMVLNPDIVAAPGAICTLAAAVAGSADRGMAVPRLTGEDGTLSRSIRRTPSVVTAASEAVLGGPRAGRLGLGEIVADPAAYAEEHAVEWATGAAVLITKRCWDAVGDWEPSFLLYSEETDYMLRARDAGLQTYFTPSAVMAHRGGESSTSPYLWALMMSNKARLYRARHNRVSAGCYRAVLLAGEAVRALLGKKRSRAAVRLLARPSTVPSTLPG